MNSPPKPPRDPLHCRGSLFSSISRPTDLHSNINNEKPEQQTKTKGAKMFTAIAMLIGSTVIGALLIIPDLLFIRSHFRYRKESGIGTYFNMIWHGLGKMIISAISITISVLIFMKGMSMGLERGVAWAVVGIIITLFTIGLRSTWIRGWLKKYDKAQDRKRGPR